MLDFIINFGNQNPLLFNSVVAIISLAILAKAADLLVYSISSYAKQLGISEYLIGFIVLAISTALPELIASITAAFLGAGEMIFGTVLGSNLFKIPLLGIVLLFGIRLVPSKKNIGNAPILTLILSIIPVLLVIDGKLSRFDGITLIISFILYLGGLWQSEKTFGKMKENVKFKSIYKNILIFTGALTALLLSARFLVTSSLHISSLLDISPFIIGLVVIGIGGSMPELTVQIRSILQHHKDLIFGNILGSIVANSSFVLGLTALIKPFHISFSSIILTSIFLVAGLFYTLLVINHGELNWKHGLIMVVFYIIFIALQLISGL